MKNFVVKPVGLRMHELIERIIIAFDEKHGIKPRYFEACNMLAEAIEKKNLTVL